jgi:RimJ/RimL family protein N-acetyltransferase
VTRVDIELEGTLVRLPIVTGDEAALMVDGGRLAWFAAGYPRPDDIDAAKMADGSAWSVRHVVRRADGLAVGSIGFFGPPDEDGQVEIGYGLIESARRQGLISDALTVAIAAAEAAGAQVIAHTSDDNVASRRTLAKFGFVREEAMNADGERLYVRPRP